METSLVALQPSYFRVWHWGLSSVGTAGRARQGRDSLEHRVTLTQHDSSSAGLFRAVPGVCKHRAGGWARGGCVSPTRLSPRGLYLAKEEAPVPSLSCVWELPEGHRDGLEAPGSGEAAGQEGWQGSSSWSISSHPDMVFAGQQVPTHLNSNSTKIILPNPKSSSPCERVPRAPSQARVPWAAVANTPVLLQRCHSTRRT